MNVTLIGMAGAGKSHIGKRLAEELKLEYFDNDDALAEKYGKDIQSILDELGEEKYLGAESQLCIERTTGRDNFLISPGGSVVYVPEWVKHLRNISTIVYLKVPYEVVAERLAKKPPRAIIGLGRKTLRQLYDEREPLYERAAHVIIEPLSMPEEKIVPAIRERVLARSR